MHRSQSVILVKHPKLCLSWGGETAPVVIVVTTCVLMFASGIQMLEYGCTQLLVVRKSREPILSLSVLVPNFTHQVPSLDIKGMRTDSIVKLTIQTTLGGYKLF